ERLGPGAERGERLLAPARGAADLAELGVEPIEHVDRVLHIGDAEEEIVLERGARVLLRAGVAIAELRAAEAVVREHAAVERHLPAALHSRDRHLRLVEELAIAE